MLQQLQVYDVVMYARRRRRFVGHSRAARPQSSAHYLPHF